MSTIALYNKWRGQTFDDLLGQDHITNTLRNQIKAGRIGHAYLFTGLRGTGKTSTARIMAKAVNCLGDTDDPPCNQCHICQSLTDGRSLDLIEIDGASNRGIDEIRDLRDRVNFAPNECRYKVYVIDEVHMLTKEAFNALLKTLEEPPEHVIFILCTTEPHRLPDTVLSRCQRFDFRRGSLAMITTKLRRICDQEEIAITEKALEYVARRATGSFRDAESLLDQLSAYGADEITLEQVQAILGATPSSLIIRLLRALVEDDASEGLRAINEAFDGGAEPRQFLADVLDHLRATMLLVVGGNEDTLGLGREALDDLGQITESAEFSLAKIVSAIKLFNEAGEGLRYAARAELPIELALVEATLPRRSGPSPVSKAPDDAWHEPPATPRAKRQESRTMPAEVSTGSATTATQGEPASKPMPPKPEASGGTGVIASAPEQPNAKEDERELTLDWVLGHWQKVLSRIRAQNAQVQALLNSTRPVEVEGSVIVLACEAQFHREKLSQDRKRLLVEQVLSEVLEMPCTVECVVDPRRQTASPTPQRGPAGDLFEGNQAPESVEQELRNHPAVRELEKQGGVVTRVHVYESEEEDKRGKQG